MVDVASFLGSFFQSPDQDPKALSETMFNDDALRLQLNTIQVFDFIRDFIQSSCTWAQTIENIEKKLENTEILVAIKNTSKMLNSVRPVVKMRKYIMSISVIEPIKRILDIMKRYGMNKSLVIEAAVASIPDKVRNDPAKMRSFVNKYLESRNFE